MACHSISQHAYWTPGPVGHLWKTELTCEWVASVFNFWRAQSVQFMMCLLSVIYTQIHLCKYCGPKHHAHMKRWKTTINVYFSRNQCKSLLLFVIVLLPVAFLKNGFSVILKILDFSKMKRGLDLKHDTSIPQVMNLTEGVCMKYMKKKCWLLSELGLWLPIFLYSSR